MIDHLRCICDQALVDEMRQTALVDAIASDNVALCCITVGAAVLPLWYPSAKSRSSGVDSINPTTPVTVGVVS